MKKYLLAAAITLLIFFTSNTAFSQKGGGSGGGCPQKELIKKFTELNDSLARFFIDLKKTTDSADYADFENAFPTDTTEALNVFGSRSNGLKDTMNALSDSIARYDGLLHSEIDFYNVMSRSTYADTLISRINCFFQDTTINTIDYTLDQCFGTGAAENMRLAGDLDCMSDMQSALQTARSNFETNLVNCYATLTCPGFWRPFCMAGCYVAYNGIYNEAKITAYCNYRHCMHMGCMFD